MILGMSISAFTTVHVVISLFAMVAGAIVVAGMLRSEQLPGWTAFFLATTLLTSLTGFLFPITVFTPALLFGVISVAALAIAGFALYGRHLTGAWRWIYIAAAAFALYLNVFVGVVQAFQKLDFLNPLAPTQSEPPFIAAQVVVLALFLALGVLAIRRFHPVWRA